MRVNGSNWLLVHLVTWLMGWLLGVSLTGSLSAQTVWSGHTLEFTKPASGDPSVFRDEITDNVWLTRGDVRGMYNSAFEAGYTNGLSPEFTLWATPENNPIEAITAENHAALTFTDWESAFGGGGLLATKILEYDAVVHLTVDDIYLDLRFTDWGQGHPDGGRFSYLRAEPPMEQLAGDFSGNGTVENADLTLLLNNWGAAVPPIPAGWDGTPPTEPAVDNDELTALLNNWGSMAGIGSGDAASQIVPEPGTGMLALLGLLVATTLRQSYADRRGRNLSNL